jgi:hypothetical protein
MSIFGSIMGAIFGKGSAQASGSPTAAPSAPAAKGSAQASGSPTAAPSAPAAKGSAQASASPTAAPSAPVAQTVDIAAIVDKAAAAKGEKLEWRTSIVDLMKALNLDSSLTARKQLAKELNYTGDTNDSATMNVWLHKQVMGKIAANGGKLPADIKT